jgi:hypothetical protein
MRSGRRGSISLLIRIAIPAWGNQLPEYGRQMTAVVSRAIVRRREPKGSFRSITAVLPDNREWRLRNLSSRRQCRILTTSGGGASRRPSATAAGSSPITSLRATAERGVAQPPEPMLFCDVRQHSAGYRVSDSIFFECGCSCCGGVGPVSGMTTTSTSNAIRATAARVRKAAL